MKTADEILDIMEKAGDSNEQSRKAVEDFHGGMENLKQTAMVWATHHYVFGTSEQDLVIAFCTAVDYGYRIAKSEKRD